MEGERIKKDIDDFAVKVRDFRNAFIDRKFFKFENGWDSSYSELNGAVSEIESLNEELYKFKRLADIFEFPEEGWQYEADVKEAFATSIQKGLGDVGTVADIGSGEFLFLFHSTIFPG